MKRYYVNNIQTQKRDFIKALKEDIYTQAFDENDGLPSDDEIRKYLLDSTFNAYMNLFELTGSAYCCNNKYEIVDK